MEIALQASQGRGYRCVKSARVEAATRAAKVEALYEWSASSTKYVSRASASIACGTFPGPHVKEVRRLRKVGARIDRD